MKNKTFVLGLLLACFVLTPRIGFGQTLNKDLVETDGYVTALGVSLGGRLYVGGVFDHMVYDQGVSLRASTSGTLSDTYVFNRAVYAAIPDGSGGFYVAGQFESRDGTSSLIGVHRIMRINSDGTINSTFDAPTINGTVRTMILNGSDLYIGGQFTAVNGSTRYRLALLNSGTGALNTGFSVAVSGNAVYSLEANSSFSKLYVGGDFTAVGGYSRDNIALIDLGGTVSVNTSFNVGTDGTVRAMRLSSNGNRIYMGGDFTTVGTKTRNHIAKINSSSGAAITGWNANANANVYDVELINSGIIVCGAFTHIGGANRKQVAKLRSDNGNAKSGFVISGTVSGTVYSITSDGGTDWYVAGNFTTFDGSTRYGTAKVDGNGSVTSWNPGPSVNNIMYTVAYDPSYSSGGVVVGGYRSPGDGLAFWCTNISTSTLANYSYDITADAAPISEFAFRNTGSENRVLAVGPNSHYLWDLIGRNNFCEWVEGGNIRDPEFRPFTGTFNGMALYGDDVVVGGSFSTIYVYSGGSYYSSTSRDNMVMVDLTTSPVTVESFDPAPNGAVTDVVIAGDIAYVCGAFTSIGGSSRAGLAAIDLTDGSITSWDPDPNGTVYSITVDETNGVVYLGGSFTSVGGASRSNIAAVDDADGDAVSGFNPGTNGTVSTLELDGGILYAGGSFTTAGGSTRNRVAAFDAGDGTLSSWDPNCNSTVKDIVVTGGYVVLGGLFSYVLDIPRAGLAAVTEPTDLSKRTAPGTGRTDMELSAGLHIAPNPISGSTEVNFVAPEAGNAELSLYGMNGARIGTLFSDKVEEGGKYDVSIRDLNLAAGIYMMRLHCNDHQYVRRVTVVK